MDPRVQTWLGHVDQLASKIGPRGSGSADEKKGAEYCEEQFRQMGFEPVVEQFLSQSSVFRPHLVAALSFALAYGIFLKLPLLSFIISLVALVSEIQELLLRPNLLRLFGSRNTSRNVFAKQLPRSSHRRDLILMGHIDTQRTPIIFSSRNWRKAYAIWSNIAMALLFLQTVLFGLSIIWPGIMLPVWRISFISLIAALSLIAITIEADSSPYTAGANDNATGVGLVLTMAKSLKAFPLESTRVWLLCSGSEEALHEGAVNFFKTHKKDFLNPVTLNFEMLGCAGPSYICKEGLLLPLRPDRKLLELVDDLAHGPEFNAYPSILTGGCTEASDSIINGIPAITLIGLEKDGFAPHWHMPSDTFDKMDTYIMENSLKFADAIIRRIDKIY
jgi:hypothetical protein